MEQRQNLRRTLEWACRKLWRRKKPYWWDCAVDSLDELDYMRRNAGEFGLRVSGQSKQTAHGTIYVRLERM